MLITNHKKHSNKFRFGEQTKGALLYGYTDGEKTFICTICKETKVETIKAAEAASGISGRSDNPAPVESGTPDAAGTVQGERHSGFSWKMAVIIAVVLAGGAAAAAAIHIKRKKEKTN